MGNIAQIISNIVDYTGFKLPGESVFDPMKNMEDAIAIDTNGAIPLADLLLYEYFDDVTGIAFNRGTLGIWFEIDPLVGSNETIEKNLTLFFNEELPEDGVVQFLIVASHDISNILDMWESKRNYGCSGTEKLTKYRRHFLETLSQDYANANDGRMPRNYRTFVTYANKDRGEKSIEEIQKFKRKLSNKLKAEHLNPQLCNAEDLILISREILQMEIGKKSTARYDVLQKISDQILESGYFGTVEADRIVHHKTGLISKIFSPSELPESFSLADMVMLLGDDYKSIPARFVISYSLANNLGAKGTSSLLAQGHRAIHAASKEYTRNDLVAQTEASEWVRVMARHKQGEVFLTESMCVMITAPKDEIEIAEEVLKSIYNTHDWKLSSCSKKQRLCALAILPMMPLCYWNAFKYFKLTRYALSGDVVAKLPIQGEWRGVPTSGALLIGRRGQLFNFNPFFT